MKNRELLVAKWLLNWIKPICEENNISLKEIMESTIFHEIKKFIDFCENNVKYNDNQLKIVLEKILKWKTFDDSLIEFENTLINEDKLKNICKTVLEENQKLVEEYYNWKLNIIWYFIWKVNQKINNNWNSKEIKNCLEQILSQK